MVEALNCPQQLTEDGSKSGLHCHVLSNTKFAFNSMPPYIPISVQLSVVLGSELKSLRKVSA